MTIHQVRARLHCIYARAERKWEAHLRELKRTRVGYYDPAQDRFVFTEKGAECAARARTAWPY